MPHIIVETSSDIAVSVQHLQAAHDILMAPDICPASAVKVRHVPLSTYVVAGQPAPFIHITLALMPGRDPVILRTILENLVTYFHSVHDKPVSVTAECRLLDPDTFIKYVHV